MEWNEQRALSLAAQARSSLKLSAGHNQLLRIGHNALVLFKGTPYVARIAGSHGQDVASPNEVAIAWHLLDHGVPAITPADFASLELEGHVVTIWHYHQPREGDTQPEPEQLVELMWTLQRAMESYPLQLPEWTPLSRIDSWLDFLREDPSLPAVDWELLSGWRERLAQRLPSVCSRLGVGPVHGDLDGNVFMTAEGPRI
jgi:Ser/Thr protein kinase RdoA (MazF antagonist)